MSLTRSDGSSCQLLFSPCVGNRRHWLNCCLTKQKLLIELMHLCVGIDLTMSLPNAWQEDVSKEGGQGKGMERGRKSGKVENSDVWSANMNTKVGTQIPTRPTLNRSSMSNMHYYIVTSRVSVFVLLVTQLEPGATKQWCYFQHPCFYHCGGSLPTVDIIWIFSCFSLCLSYFRDSPYY